MDLKFVQSLRLYLSAVNISAGIKHFKSLQKYNHVQLKIEQASLVQKE